MLRFYDRRKPNNVTVKQAKACLDSLAIDESLKTEMNARLEEDNDFLTFLNETSSYLKSFYDHNRCNSISLFSLDVVGFYIIHKLKNAYEELQNNEKDFKSSLKIFMGYLCALAQTIHQDKKGGCNLHIMPELPSNLAEYKNSYTLINEQLQFIKFDGNVESVEIGNWSKFANEIKGLSNDSVKIFLSDHQIYELITSNGGHVPNRVRMYDPKTRDKDPYARFFCTEFDEKIFRSKQQFSDFNYGQTCAKALLDIEKDSEGSLKFAFSSKHLLNYFVSANPRAILEGRTDLIVKSVNDGLLNQNERSSYQII